MILLPQMEDSEDEEQEEEEEEAEEESEEFNVIPPYSEKDSNVESGARGSKRAAASQASPLLPLLLLLPSLVLDWECWSYWSLTPHAPCLYFTKACSISYLFYSFSSIFIFKAPRLYFVIPFLLPLPPQELKDISSPAGSAASLPESPPMKRSEQRRQIYECMGEFRNAVWANTLSGACFTLKVHPLF